MTDRTWNPNGEPDRGRNVIAFKAMRSVIAAVAADALTAPTSQVRVELADVEGLLSVTVNAPIRLGALASPDQHATDLTVVERGVSARHTIVDTVTQLTGAQIGSMNLRISGVRLERERRVR